MIVIIVAVVAVQFPSVQRSIVQKALASLSEKTHTRIHIGSVSIAFTNSIVLHDIFLESRQRDTLLYVQTLAADVNLLGLLSHHIKLRNVRIDTLNVHITRTLPDSSFNFDFILRALSSDSTNAEPPASTSASPVWKFQFGGLQLNSFRGTYDDNVSGLKLAIRLGTLKASLDKFDIDKEHFHVDDLALENTTASVVDTKESLPDDSPSRPVDLSVGSLSLKKIHFVYEDILTGERYSVDLGMSTLLAERVDIPSHRIAVKNLRLENTNVVITEPETDGGIPEHSGATVVPWVITLDHLLLNNNSLHYDDLGAEKTAGLDPNHFRLDGLVMRAENLYYSKNRMKAEINHTSVREQSGLALTELSGAFVLDTVHAQFKDFTVATSASVIHHNVLLRYPSLAALENFADTVNVEATFTDSRIAIADILLFQPSLPIKNVPGASVHLSSSISGPLRDLRVEQFRATLGDSSVVDFTGSIRGLSDVKTASFDMHLSQFSSGREDIQALLADTVLPGNIVLPASILISGTFHGTTRNFSTSTALETSIGNLKGSVVLDSGPASDSIESRWNADLDLEEFDIGSLLNDPATFGPVSLTASATGTGLSKDDVKAQLNVEVDQAVLLGYPYRGISLQGTAGPNMFEGTVEVQDSNIALTFKGSVNTSEEDPKFTFTLDLRGADLRRLNLTSDDIRLSGRIMSNLTGQDINSLSGTFGVRNVVMIKDGKRFFLDSLVCTSVNSEKQTHIVIESTVFKGQLDGKFVPGELPELLKEQGARFFTLNGEERRKNLRAQAFTFRVTLRDPAILTDIVFPDIHRLSAGTVEGNFDSDNKTLNATILLPRIDYEGFRFDSLSVMITFDANQLRAAVRVGSLSDTTLRVTNLQLIGKAAHDSIDIALQSTRTDGSIPIRLAGGIQILPDGYKWQFKPDGIVFQNVQWHVPADHWLIFGKGQFVAHNVILQGPGESLSLSSTSESERGSPVKLEFADFDISTFARVVERDSGLVQGILNGNVVLSTGEAPMAFTSDLTIKDLGFRQRLIGDVVLRANHQSENLYDLTMNISGHENRIALKGTYRSVKEGDELDLACDFANVNLASIEPFTFGNVQRLSGTMSGGLHMTGTWKNPSVAGELNFSNAAFAPSFLDTYLHLNNGTIQIDDKGIDIKSFDLIDTLGNTASVSGHLLTEDFRTYQYDVRVHTDKFLLLNKAASRNALYYGTVVLNSDISIEGDQRRPVVTVQAELAKGTNLALVVPESELAVEERLGIVFFVDTKVSPNSIMARQNPRPEGDTTAPAFSSMDLTSNITVNKESKLRILIDPVAGDSLVIQGEATLSLTMDPTGKLTLTGRYEILQGSYRLSFGDFIKREFAIEKGSSLTWSGSPLEADVDITAMYTVKAAVLDLVQDQLAGLSQEERNKYRQELPIQVYLMMKGKLLKPEIHFRLDLPPEQQGVLGGAVYAKLNQLNEDESELNKQVFGLLVLGRFISENSLASAVGSNGISDFARSSVSEILSTQLNRLSEQYIAGANLHVGLASYQDYSSGTAEGRTQLQLALSKQLFDERVTVQVGGNVDLEGRRSQQNSLNSFAGDLKVMYKLTDDGRWQLQVFRQNSYEGAIDGDITKTGIGAVFSIDFDKLFGITLKPVPNDGKK